MDTLKATDNKVKTGGDFLHTYSQEEVEAYCDHINHYLRDDPDVAEHLPINPDSLELFAKVGDGIILCKLVNLARHDTIDKRAIVVKKPLNIFNMNVPAFHLFSLDQSQPRHRVRQIHRLHCR